MIFPKEIVRQKSVLPHFILFCIAFGAHCLLVWQALFWALPILWFFLWWECRQKSPIAFRFLKDGRFFYADTINAQNTPEWQLAQLNTLYFWHPFLICLCIQNGKKRTLCLYRTQFSQNDFRYLRLFFKFLATQKT